MKRNSSKDVNDKLMQSAGFYRCPQLDVKSFNDYEKSLHPISYWVNDLGVRVVTLKREKIDLPKLVQLITENVTYQTRRRIRDQLRCLDYGEGFKPIDK